MMLKSIATQLENTAKSDLIGGWSTNHVKPMRDLADQIHIHLGRGGSDLDKAMMEKVASRLVQFDKELTIGGWSTQNREFFQTTSKRLLDYTQ